MEQKYTLFSIEPASTEWYLFKKETELGAVHSEIPWEELSALLPETLKLKGGAPSWLDRKGMLGLMFLKHYTSLSDEKLIDRLNTDYAFQFFCNFRLQLGEKIRDKTLVTRVRKYISTHCDFEQLQAIFAKHWKPKMKDTHVMLIDATCYEVQIAYPTDSDRPLDLYFDYL